MIATYIKKIMCSVICVTSVYSRKIISILFIGKVSGLFKTVNIGIHSDTINVINVKLCMVVLLIELYLVIPLSVTLTTFQGHSSVAQF